jgi:hypothetical protein
MLQSYGFFNINAIKSSKTIEFLEKLTPLGLFVREEVRRVRNSGLKGNVGPAIPRNSPAIPRL